MVEVGDKGTMNIAGEIAAKGNAYSTSFGQFGDRTCYYDGKGFDMREDIQKIAMAGMKSFQAKALGPATGGAGTAGNALVPVYVDSRIVDISRKRTPLVELISRVTNIGLTADYNRLLVKGSAYTAQADGATPESDDEYERKSHQIKYLYSVGRVLGPMQAAMPSYILEGFNPNNSASSSAGFGNVNVPNAQQVEITIKAKALKELEENLILNGDSSSDTTQYDGIIKQQGTENVKDKLNTALVWSDIDECIELASVKGGMPKLGVASPGVITALRQIMIDVYRVPPTSSEIAFGIPSAITIETNVGPIPIIQSRFLSNDSGAKQLYFLDTDYIEMRVLQDMMYKKLADTNDSDKFMLKIYECLIVRAPEFNCFIDNIQ